MKHLKIILPLLAGLIIFSLLNHSFKTGLILLILIAIASLSTFYYNYFHGPINFELIKISTIISTVAYGIAVGLLVAIFSSVLSRIWSGRFDHRVIISLVGVILMSISANVFREVNIICLGIILVAAYHIVTLPISIAAGDSYAFAIPYAVTNIFFNALLFIFAAQPLLAIIR